MNRFAKFKVKDAFANMEDSSDYLSSDVENSISASASSTAVGTMSDMAATNRDTHKLMLNNIENSIMLEDSNDSFLNDASSSVGGGGVSHLHHHQQQQDTLSSNLNYFAHLTDKSHSNQPSTPNRVNFQAKMSSSYDVNSQQQQNNKSIDEGRLAECLDYLHRMISRKDKEDIFQYPVTDDIAPGYSLIIENPMDLSTMRKKIDSHAYNSLVEYRDDLILMCENCMTYNKPDTIYYTAARKMLDYGLKMLSKDKLKALRNNVRIMRYLTVNEIGFSLDGESSNDNDPSPQLIRQRAEQIAQKTFSSAYAARLAAVASVTSNKSKLLTTIEYPKESFLLPPEGDDSVSFDHDIAEEVKQAASRAAQRLAAKNKNGKIGFLRRNSNGTLGYNFLKASGPIVDDDDEEEEEEENQENDTTLTTTSEATKTELEPALDETRSVTMGNLSEGLQANLYTMTSFTEDKKNKSKPIYYVENGPFSSHAPVYDTSYSNLSKEDTDLLLSVYGDETAYQYALSLMEFSKGTGAMFNRYTNLVLNTMTGNEHERYLKYVRDKHQIKQEQALQSAQQSVVVNNSEQSSLKLEK